MSRLIELPWNSQPQEYVEPVRSGPLGELLFLYSGGNAVDLSGLWAADPSNAPNFAVSRSGVGAAACTLNFSLGRTLATDRQLVVVGVASISALNPLDTLFSLYETVGGAEYRYGIDLFDTEKLVIRVRNSSTNIRSHFHPRIYAVGEPIKFCGVWNGSSSRALYTDDGQFVSSSLFAGWLGEVTDLRLGPFVDSSLQMLAVFSGPAPSAEQAIAAAADPWAAVFKPQSIWVPVSAGGGGLPTLTWRDPVITATGTTPRVDYAY